MELRKVEIQYFGEGKGFKQEKHSPMVQKACPLQVLGENDGI